MEASVNSVRACLGCPSAEAAGTGLLALQVSAFLEASAWTHLSVSEYCSSPQNLPCLSSAVCPANHAEALELWEVCMCVCMGGVPHCPSIRNMEVLRSLVSRLSASWCHLLVAHT